MNRVPEPELMLDDAQACAYAGADFAEPHDHFVALLRQRLTILPTRGVALDLGCGPGDVTRRFARAFRDWSVDGIDASPAMLALGRTAADGEGLGGRVTFVEALLPTDTLPRERYDLVFSNSLLHHLADPAPLWNWLARRARGTPLFLMDLLRPADRQTAASLVDRYAAGEPDVLRSDFFNSLLAAYTSDELTAQLDAARLAHLAVEIVSDRHLIAWGRI